jgi:hypothetical protein
VETAVVVINAGTWKVGGIDAMAAQMIDYAA